MTYVKRFGAASVLAAVVAVTGCGQAPAAPPASPAPADSRAEDHAPREQLVAVAVSGGFAGIRNHLAVRYDGSYTLTRGAAPPTTGRMTPGRTAELRAALEDPAFAAVPEHGTGRPVADGFEYRITYGHRVVVTRDGEECPAALRRVLDALPEGHPPTSP